MGCLLLYEGESGLSTESSAVPDVGLHQEDLCAYEETQPPLATLNSVDLRTQRHLKSVMLCDAVQVEHLLVQGGSPPPAVPLRQPTSSEDT